MTALAVPGVARAQTVQTTRLDGLPLDVFVDGIGDLQLRYDGQPPSEDGEFYGSAYEPSDNGFALRTADDVSLPDSFNRTAISAPKLTDDGKGTRTVTSTFDVATENSDHNPDVTVRVVETVSYTDGDRDVHLRFAITNIGNGPASFTAGELADLEVGGRDDGTGVFQPESPRFIGGSSPFAEQDPQLADGLQEVKGSEWTAYEEGEYDKVFDDFAADGLTNTVSDEDIDNEVGVEWKVDGLGAGATKTIEAVWRVNSRPLVPVTTTDDVDDGECEPQQCTLRDAIKYADSGSIIVVPAGTYRLSGRELDAPADRTLAIAGAGAQADGSGTTIDGGLKSRVLQVPAGATVSMTGVRLTQGNGQAPDAPAGSLANGLGGALAVDQGGALALTDSAVVDSVGGDLGGGIASYGELTILRSTIAHNKATGGEGQPHGGGIFTGDVGSAAIMDSTVADNQATGGTLSPATGGGIAFEGDLTVSNTTIADNTADSGGGIAGINTPPLTLDSTILARNTPNSCAVDKGDQISTSQNLADDDSCPLSADDGDLIGKDALLGELGDHGGPTESYAPADKSPAIDSGICFGEPVTPFDQRGERRNQGRDCDIGSVEAPNSIPTPSITSPKDGTTLDSPQITLQGRAEPGDDVRVFDPLQDVGDEALADANGNWSVTLDDVRNGVYRFIAQACRPELGCSDSSDAVTMTVQATQTGPPAPPVIASPVDGSTVNTRVITFSGTAAPDAEVDVNFADDRTGGTSTTAGSDGRWTATLSLPDDGTYQFNAVACNDSGCSDEIAETVTIDTTAPAAPAIVTAPSASGSTVTLSGTADRGSTVDVFDNGTLVRSVAAPDGTWSTTLTGVTPGQHSYTAVARDAAGNRSAASAPRDVVVAQPQQATPTPTPTPTATPTPLPPPVKGKQVNAQTRSGTIKIKLPGTNKFVVLGPGQQIPTGTTVDTTHGRITLTTAVGGGRTQHADFYKGIFRVTQSKGRHPVTQLALAGPRPTCTTTRKHHKARASAARKKKKHKKRVKTRRLWGSGHGAFRTKGQYSSATVRGTTWLTQDSCAGTLTRVTHGVVQVRDFRRHKKVLVRAGHHYLARAKRR